MDLFVLPAGREATSPPEARGLRRDQVRLLVTRRSDGRVWHARFRDLPRFLDAGDLVVVNDSATLPARLPARRGDGERLYVHLSTRLVGEVWLLEPRHADDRPGPAAGRVGEALQLPGGGIATLLAAYRGSSRLWVALLQLPEEVHGYLQRWGEPIRYGYVRERWPLQAYQTLFARRPGSAEMPSAARPFTVEVVRALARRGVRFATVTLHTGVASLEAGEPPHEEWYDVPAATAAKVEAARAAGRRVVAVGTTVVRALESALDRHGRVRAGRGWTDLMVTPERGVRVVDALITGLHEPGSSHLSLLEAVAGRDHLALAYRVALSGPYLWHEFGDVHLIL